MLPETCSVCSLITLEHLVGHLRHVVVCSRGTAQTPAVPAGVVWGWGGHCAAGPVGNWLQNGAGTPLPGRARVWKPRGGPEAARHRVLWHGVLWHGVLRPGAGGDRAGVGWVSCIFPALQPCKFAKHEARALFPWLLPAPRLLVRSLEQRSSTAPNATWRCPKYEPYCSTQLTLCNWGQARFSVRVLSGLKILLLRDSSIQI